MSIAMKDVFLFFHSLEVWRLISVTWVRERPSRRI